MEVPSELMQELRNLTETLVEVNAEQAPARDSRNLLGLCPVFLIMLMVVLRVCWTLYRSFGQKTRAPPARRMYAGSRHRPSLTTQEPTIYVSPSNLPPPPKYEYMAPPSYEEVVGIHYPNYQVQPISQPISAALAQTSSNNTPPTTTDNVVVSTVDETAPPPPAPAPPASSESRPAPATVMR